jgi:hypothetical protein
MSAPALKEEGAHRSLLHITTKLWCDNIVCVVPQGTTLTIPIRVIYQTLHDSRQFVRAVKNLMESLILAQSERWRRA